MVLQVITGITMGVDMGVCHLYLALEFNLLDKD
jgi:hypothetical protein